MANPQRGEAELRVGTESYTVVLSMNAICEMQERTGKTYLEMVNSMRRLDFVALRDMLWMTLKKYHSKEFETADKVGDLIDRLDGKFNDAIEVLNKVFELNAAKDKKLKPKKADTANPQAA